MSLAALGFMLFVKMSNGVYFVIAKAITYSEALVSNEALNI